MFNNVDAIDDEAEEEEDDAQVTWTVYNEWDVEAPIPVREDEDDMSALIVRRLMIAFYSHYTTRKLTKKQWSPQTATEEGWNEEFEEIDLLAEGRRPWEWAWADLAYDITDIGKVLDLFWPK